MKKVDLSLPRIIDLANHQRQRARRTLTVINRHISAQQRKAERLRGLVNRLPELIGSEGEDREPQLEKHKIAARREYEEAVSAVENLHRMRENLQHEGRSRSPVEGPEKESSHGSNRASGASNAHQQHPSSRADVIPLRAGIQRA